MNFKIWWEEYKYGVCYDLVKELDLDFNDPKIQARLMHIACQAWVASSTFNPRTNDAID